MFDYVDHIHGKRRFGFIVASFREKTGSEEPKLLAKYRVQNLFALESR